MAKAYTRLENDERRRRLLELGADVFTRNAFDEVSMAQIAREAGISKALLYHYFPSKRDYFIATLSEGAEELRAAIEPVDGVPPAEALSASVGAYLAWIDAHGDSYRKLLQSAWSVPEVRALVEGVRGETAARIIEGLGVEDPAARTAVHGWLWFMDGACLHWLDHRDMDLDTLRDLVLGALAATLGAAGALSESTG
jgi:AcrR family transcriptional regulator